MKTCVVPLEESLPREAAARLSYRCSALSCQLYFPLSAKSFLFKCVMCWRPHYTVYSLKQRPTFDCASVSNSRDDGTSESQALRRPSFSAHSSSDVQYIATEISSFSNVSCSAGVQCAPLCASALTANLTLHSELRPL